MTGCAQAERPSTQCITTGDLMRVLAFKQVAFIGVATFALIGPGSAQPRDDYPSQTLKLIAPFAAGGLPDTVASIVATSLQTRLKQTVVVRDRSWTPSACSRRASCLLRIDFDTPSLRAAGETPPGSATSRNVRTSPRSRGISPSATLSLKIES
jgi:hypothetical protein